MGTTILPFPPPIELPLLPADVPVEPPDLVTPFMPEKIQKNQQPHKFQQVTNVHLMITTTNALNFFI